MYATQRCPLLTHKDVHITGLLALGVVYMDNTVCRRLGFGKRRLREQNINRSEPAAPKSQHINSDTAAPREDFSADVNYTTADPGHSATITQQCNNQGGRERFSSLSRIKRSPPGSTATFADRACAPRESAFPRLAFSRHPGAV